MRVRSLNGEERELIPVEPCHVCGTIAAGIVCPACIARYDEPVVITSRGVR